MRPRRKKRGAKKKAKDPFYIRATKEHGRKFPGFLLFVIVVVAISWEVNRFVRVSTYFKLTTIQVKTNGRLDNEAVSELIGRKDANIFEIDLAESVRSLEKRPEIKRARIRRALPDTLVVNVVERIPAAQVRANRYFPIDEECIMLPWVTDEPASDIPVIIGVGLKTRRVIPGKPYHSNQLARAMELLKAISNSRSLSDTGVARIDVRDLEDVSFVTDDAVEVKIGEDELERKIRLMDKIILDAKSRGRGLNYIDLRFGDVIVGWK